LRVDGAVGVALAETALRLAHGFSGAAEVVHIALALTLLARLTLLVLAETAVLELFEQFVEAVAQGLLALRKSPNAAAGAARLPSSGRRFVCVMSILDGDIYLFISL
jgi:hypothetical protein